MAKAKRDNELRLVREFNAPVKLVWESWTDLKQVEKWWGPRGFTLTTKRKDLRAGGKWIYTMHGPDGVDYPNITTYHEVEEHRRLAYDHGATEERAPLFRVTVTFTEAKGKTLMDLTMSLASPEAAREVKKFIKQAGGDSTWDRLGEYLEQEKTGGEIFLINRSFEAGQKSVFEMWSRPELYLKWMGPAGTRMHFLRAEVKEGGEAFWSMTNADGSVKYGKLRYNTIRPDGLFAYTQNFCDERGELTKHPLAATWPDHLRMTAAIVPEGEGETRVTVKWEIEGRASAAERQTFASAKAAMTQGWSESFDKMEAALREG